MKFLLSLITLLLLIPGTSLGLSIHTNADIVNPGEVMEYWFDVEPGQDYELMYWILYNGCTAEPKTVTRDAAKHFFTPLHLGEYRIMAVLKLNNKTAKASKGFWVEAASFNPNGAKKGYIVAHLSTQIKARRLAVWFVIGTLSFIAFGMVWVWVNQGFV